MKFRENVAIAATFHYLILTVHFFGNLKHSWQLVTFFNFRHHKSIRSGGYFEFDQTLLAAQ